MGNYSLVCRSCGERCEGDAYRCPSCGGILNTEYPFDRRDALCSALRNARQYWDYEPFFPIGRECEKVTMGEGFTPLVPTPGIARAFGIRQMSIKNEGLNPTGTFKDRCMSISISKAKALGASAVVIGSAGNAGAAAAAYAARAGIPCYVMVPASTPPERVAQIQLYGARVILVRGSVTDCIDLIARVYRERGWHNVTTASAYNPFQADSEKAIAYEMAKASGWEVPDWLFVPIGGGGILSGIYRGYLDLFRLGLVKKLPRMVGTQEEGCCAVVNAFRAGRKPTQIERVENPAGIAVAIADAYPLDGETALQAIYDSGGCSESVSSAEILEAQRLLGRTEGIFAEAASSTTLAAAKKLREKGVVQAGDSVACVVTGSGLKDLQLAARHMPRPAEVEIDPEQLNRVVDGMEAAV